MHTFSNIDKEKTREDFLYSELLALSYCDVEFLKFVNEERNRYLMNDKVFQNQFIYELRKHNVKIEEGKETIFPICIEKDWDYLKDVYECSIAIKKEIPACEEIVVKKDNCLLFDNKIVGGKSKTDMITITDLEQALGTTKQEIYESDFDSLVAEFIITLQQYMKPEFLGHLNYFLDIFEESGLDMNYSNYKNFKVQGLGERVDELPKLCYNNLADFCNDVISYEPAFRDYSLMLDVWEQFKHETFNIGILIPLIQGKDKTEGFKNLVCKIYGLKDMEFYRFDSKNKAVFLPSKSEYQCNDLTEKYKTDNKKDFYLCLYCDNIEIRILVSIGKAPYEIEISNKLIENIDYERF
jgi:hypothetical protein